MAKIKNKTELVRRVKWHREQDNLIRGEYSVLYGNGKVKFEGCGIGCAATPHGQAALREHYESLPDNGPIYARSEDPQTLLARLRQDFGVTPALARSVEAVTEGLEDDQKRGKFLVDFAEALPEGVDVTPRMVRAAVEHVGGCVISYGRDDYQVEAGWTAEELGLGVLNFLRAL